MALFIKQTESRSELQSKVAAQLQERLKERDKIEYKKPDPAILKDKQQTNGLGIIISILAIILVAFIVYLLRP